MISQAAADGGLVTVYFLLTAASAGVFLHAGIKFPWFVFFQKDSGLRPKEAPWNMAAAMVIFATICILLGIFPEPFYALLPYPVDYVPYTAGKVLFYLQLLLFSGLAFFLLLPWMKRTLTISLDIDWLWRVLATRIGSALYRFIGTLGRRLEDSALTRMERLAAFGQRHLGVGKDEASRGIFASTWAIGTTTLWIAVLLIAYLLVYFL
jgi:multicomponent Na+:H+ antiporter subunit D